MGIQFEYMYKKIIYVLVRFFQKNMKEKKDEKEVKV